MALQRDPDTAIDTALTWITQRQAKYISKIDQIIWFQSLTGRIADNDWVHVTPEECIRMISYSVAPINKDDLITAFQEANQIYDFAVESTHPTPHNVFNYNSLKLTADIEYIIDNVFKTVHDAGINKMVLKDINILIDNLLEYYQVPNANQIARAKMVRRLATKNNFVYRERQNRFNNGGKPHTGIAHKDHLACNYTPHSKADLADLEHAAKRLFVPDTTRPRT